MRVVSSLVIVLGGAWVAATARAQEASDPGLDFLEYLGSWQERDDEWMLVAEWEKDRRNADEDEPSPPPDPERESDRDDQGK